MAPPLPFMDHAIAARNPCSVESLPAPVRLANGSWVWPTIVSCYELNEETGVRMGRADLYAIIVPDIAGSTAPELPLSLDNQQTFCEGPSGILDGKWMKIITNDGEQHDDDDDDGNDGEERSSNNSNNNRNAPQSWLFCTAQSTGEIRAYEFRIPASPAPGLPLLDSDPLYSIQRLAGQAMRPPGFADDVLCLSVNWNLHHDNHHRRRRRRNNAEDDNNDSTPDDTTTTVVVEHQIVSSYSNGYVAIHDVSFRMHNTNSNTANNHKANRVQFVLRDAWPAHTMFKNPAEVWSACFAQVVNNNNHSHDDHSASTTTTTTLVLSCGDEGKLKLWDLRSTQRPVQVWDDFQAGVTCVSQHPRHAHLVACGSYDERVGILNVQQWYPHQTAGAKLQLSEPLGGGIWRLQWHPIQDDRLLIAAMHGGCRVVRIANLFRNGDNDTHNHDKTSIRVRKKFVEHESMAYGATWLVCRHPTQNGFFEAAASCSFYDRNVFLWDTLF